MQEAITFRLTSVEREARRLLPGSPPDEQPYVQLANPIASDRSVMRHSLLSSLLEVVERNARLRQRIALFEIGPVFLGSEEGELPEERAILGIALTGQRALPAWQGADTAPMDFFDLKGVVQALLENLQLEEVRYEPVEHPSFHPGKCARVLVGGRGSAPSVSCIPWCAPATTCPRRPCWLRSSTCKPSRR